LIARRKKKNEGVSNPAPLVRRLDMRRTLPTPTALVALVTLLFAGACGARTPTPKEPVMSHASSSSSSSSSSSPVRAGHVAAHGVDYYYEVHGEGEPLLLLHGGLGSIDMFTPLLPSLVKTRQVIGVDLHGHGRTRLGDRKLSVVDLGRDLAVVLDQLGYAQVDVLGYSFGGGAAFQLAVQHPQKVRRLVLVSAGFATDGFYPEILAQQNAIGAAAFEMMKDTPMYQSYAAIAPDPSEFPRLLDAIGELMREPFNHADDVKKLTMPVMLVFGDSDMYRPEHVIEFYKLLGGGQRDPGWMREHMSPHRLAILPDLTHYEIFMAPALLPTVMPFLDGARPAQP